MNRKFLSVILCLLLTASLAASAALSASAENPRDVDPYAKGDPTGDGKISMLDVTDVQRFIAGLIDFDNEQEYAADVNYDDKITMSDVTDLQKYLADLISFSPTDSPSDSDTDHTLTINGKEFREGDTVNYIVALECTSGDITAVNAQIKYDTSLLSFEYDEEDNKDIFPVIHEDVVANIVDGEGFYFNSHIVKADYSGFDFESKKALVKMSFTVMELSKDKECEISCDISEMLRYDEKGFTDLILDGEILSDSVTILDTVS